MAHPGILARGIGERSAPHTAGGSQDTVRLAFFAALGAGMGIIGALAAWVLYHLIMIITGIAFYRTLTTRVPLYPPAGGMGIGVVLVPVIGGLLVGVMAKYGSERIRGHGIPEAMEAVLRFKARVGPRIAIFKPISAAIAVGTGGPFGAEGPIIQTAGAIGSLIGQSLRLTSAERRILLACGGAAGMVGIFNTPIAGVALALELLLFEFRARSLVPVVIASAVAAACRTLLLGGAVMFSVPSAPGIGGPLDLLWFVPLGVLVGVGAVVISKTLYFIEAFFDRLPVDVILKPALGALALGLIALFQPLVLGMGYSTITRILANHFSGGTLLGLAVGKSAALVAALGSGTSGGLLAPMLMIGAALGSGYGRGVRALFPHAGINPSICAIVAMSSLFSAAARAPLTSFIFAFELTGDYRAVVPLMIGCMVADIVARALASESVMTERLAQRGLHVDQDYAPNLLNLVSVGEVMTRTIDTLAARTPLRVAVRGLLGEPIALRMQRPAVPSNGATASNGTTLAIAAADGHPSSAASGIADGAPPEGEGDTCSLGLHQRWSFPVVDDAGRVLGVVTRAELLAAVSETGQDERPVREIITRAPVVAYPDESLDNALLRLLAGDFALLPVVARADGATLLGVLSRGDILRARLVREAEETHRERMFAWHARRHPRAPAVPAEGALAGAERAALDPSLAAPPEEDSDA